MNKLIRWLKAVNQNAKLRGQLILAARDRLAGMDPHWTANQSNDDVAVLLMRVGLVSIEAVYQGRMAAQVVITREQARVNQTAAHLN